MLILQAKPEHVREILELIQQASLKEILISRPHLLQFGVGLKPASESSVQKMAKDLTLITNNRKRLIAADGEKVVGYISVDCFGGEVVLSSLYVHPSHQKMKIGSKLLTEIISAYPKMPIILNVPSSNPTAVYFYSRFGFIIDASEESHFANGDGLGETGFFMRREP